MAFIIPREEYVNKTFRISKELVDQMSRVCMDKNISLNKLTVLCIRYALSHLAEEEDSTDGRLVHL